MISFASRGFSYLRIGLAGSAPPRLDHAFGSLRPRLSSSLRRRGFGFGYPFVSPKGVGLVLAASYLPSYYSGYYLGPCVFGEGYAG